MVGRIYVSNTGHFLCLFRPPECIDRRTRQEIANEATDSHVMAVDPRHQERKAGMALLQWGLDLADRAGLPLYIEASPSTVGMYEKAGFERLRETVVHKAEVMGTESDIEVPLMARMPSCAGGTTFKEWLQKE